MCFIKYEHIILDPFRKVKHFLHFDLTKRINYEKMVNDDDKEIGSECDTDSPLDSERLGLEDQMGEVIDVRPDRFLREMRESGSVSRACDKSGLTQREVEDLCRRNRKFDTSQVECYLEYLEEAMMAEARKRVKSAREQAYADLRARHG